MVGWRFAPAEVIRTSLTFVSITTVAVLATVSQVSLADPKREVPDYDGRGNQDADADSWAFWIPRILLSPLYVTHEYVVRRPLGAFVSHAERDRWGDSAARMFSFGEGDRSLILPSAAFDAGLLPRVGLFYSREDAFADGNVVQLHAATWGRRWITLSAADRYAISASDSLQVGASFRHAEDNLFVGIGPDVTQDTRSRYGLERFEGRIRYQRRLTATSRLEAGSGVQRIGFVEGDCCDDPSLDTRIASADLMAPPGYRDAYTAAHARVAVSFDTRRPRPDPGGGAYLDVEGMPAFDVHGGRSWIRYGGVLGGALDLTGHRRTITVQLALDFVDAMTGDAIPFTEYAVLDSALMPGFVTGWMTGRSTAAAQLGYSWPVWLGLDARTRFTLGNAFGAHLDGLAARKLRMSGDIGLTTSTDPDSGLEILVGLGSETFEQGADITSVRVMLGAKRSL